MNADLLKYWPTQESVAACLKIDAESASEAVFLAVHQPVTFERYEIGSQSGNVVRCGEQELLDAFLKPNLSDGRVIIPLVGSAGLGKSHVVRWIHSKLQQMPDADRRVVIRIPKGTSLKGVLGLLLDKLDDPEYEPFREKLRKAQDELDADEAAGLLCEMLAHTLIENAQAAGAILQNNPNDRETRAVQAYGDPKIMPTLLRNQRLRDLHFIKDADVEGGPIRRLVEQLTVSRDSSEGDDRKHQFVPDDLLFGSVPVGELGVAEQKALTFIDRAERRAECAKVLNKALVDAKERLLGIDPTVTELFDKVRRKLLGQNKELLLLVEDFAVLSGIQKQLLQVVIKEATRDGEQILCTMRSILAYTSGYLDTATVLTRAGTEYRIYDAEGEDVEILSRIEKLVGAYLNAARTGQSNLDFAYKKSRGEATGRRDEWLPHFEADISTDSRKVIEAFSTADGYPLFPFNRTAIRELSYEGCVRADKLIFNPRFVIQNVLNRVLLNRGSFEAGDFPPVEFTNPNRQLASRVAQVIRPKVKPDDFEKWLRFMRYWGGNPSTPQEVSFAPRTARAFGLDPSALASVGDVRDDIEEPVIIVGAMTSTRSGPSPTPDPPVVNTSKRDPVEAGWERDLESWRNGQRMGQVQARELRKLLAKAANKMINWDWELIKPLESAAGFPQHVYIPLAPGNEQYSEGSDNVMFAVCTDEERTNSDTSSKVISALMAAVRYHIVHSESWDYPGAEADLPLYSAYMEPRVQSAKEFVIARCFRTPSPFDPITALVQGLLVGGRALGIAEPAKDKDYASMVNALFAATPTLEAPQSYKSTYSSDPWNLFTASLSSLRRKEDESSWTNYLLSFVGARQGGGATVHAIDVSRLKGALDIVTRTWEFDVRLPERGNTEYSQFRRTYMDLRKHGSSIDKEAGIYRNWVTAMKEWLGEDFDKDLLVAQLKDTVDRAKNAGFATNLEPAALVKLIDDFRGVRFKAAFDAASKMSEAAPRGLILSILGAGHRDAVTASYALQAKITPFFDEVEKRMASQSAALGQNPKQDALDALKLELSRLEAPLKEVCGL